MYVKIRMSSRLKSSMNRLTINITDDRLNQLQETAPRLGLSIEELVLMGIENLLTQPETSLPRDRNWQYLVQRPHPWRRQLYIKGRKLLAFTVWQDMIVNKMSKEESADNWDLSLAAIQEVIEYCETHKELLKMEANEEYYRLDEKGVSLEP